MTQRKKRKLSLPRSTVINGERWLVRRKRKITLDGDLCDGLCDFDNHTIEIASDIKSDYQLLATYFHEAAHAIFSGSGIELTLDQEHALIAGLQRWLAANCDLRDRPRKPRESRQTPRARKTGRQRG